MSDDLDDLKAAMTARHPRPMPRAVPKIWPLRRQNFDDPPRIGQTAASNF